MSRLLCVVVALSSFAPLARAQNWSEGGYADQRSVTPGATVTFRIATSVSPFSLKLVNIAQPNTVLATISGLTSQPNDCTGKWQNGCGWPITTQYTVPSTWKPGYYAAQFPTTDGTRNVLFIVKPATPGSYAPVVVIQPTNSYTAYNQFGGKSVYDALSSDGVRANVVSFKRPYSDDDGLGRFWWEQAFIEFMAAEGRKFEVITDDDLEAATTPLTPYKAVFVIGHSEYWSLNGRRKLEAFSNAGGHVAILGGNTMWWQVRLDEQQRQMTIYKSASLDPQLGVNNSVVTVNWYDRPLFNPENLIIGLSFRNGGYANQYDDFSPVPADQRTPFTVRNPASWVFDKTNVAAGQLIGQAAAGTELDGALFNTLPDGRLAVDGSDGTPLNFDILATIAGTTGYGTMGMYVNSSGGAVFNAGSRDWSFGLYGDPVIQQMTRNMLDRFATGQPFPYQLVTSPNRMRDLFNTPSPVPGILPGWTGSLLNLSLTAGCASEGPTGLRLKGTQYTQIARNFAPRNEALSSAEVNLMLNMNGLQDASSYWMPIIELVNVNGTSESKYGRLEMNTSSQGKFVRLTAQKANGSITASTNPVRVGAGWHSVRISWKSPGAIEMNVGGVKEQAFNTDSGQTVNTMYLNFPAPEAVGSICVDELLLRDTFAPASASTSTISATPTTITADGTSTSTINVQLKDSSGDNIIIGGESVVLTTNSGTLSAVTDNGDGTYVATLTSPTVPGSATVTGTLNGTQISSSATVTFTAGAAAAVTLTAPSRVTTGAAFNVTVTARDANGNVATSYAGTVHFNVNDSAATLPADYAFQAGDNGSHQFSGVILRTSGARTLTVTDTSSPAIIASVPITVETTTTLPAPASINASPATTTRVAVTWSAVANAATYAIERSSNGAPFGVVGTVNAPGTSYQDLTVTPNVSYFYFLSRSRDR